MRRRWVAARKVLTALTVTVASIVVWFVVGLLVNVGERLIPDDEQIVSGTFTIGNTEVNAAVFTTMIIWTGLLVFTWIRSLVVVWRGGTFKEALDVALWREK